MARKQEVVVDKQDGVRFAQSVRRIQGEVDQHALGIRVVRWSHGTRKMEDGL